MTPNLRKVWQQEPLKFQNALWPDIAFYDKQIEIVESVRDNIETYVPAGNMLGKDFIAGFIAVWFFTCYHPVKILTTSATESHLDTLWGEIDRFIRTSRIPLTADKGGPLQYNHRHISKVLNGELIRDVYLKGVVASSEKKGEGLAGHHSLHTLFICDEASGVTDVAYSMAQGWAKHMLIIGNPNPCENFFKAGVKGGDLAA